MGKESFIIYKSFYKPIQKMSDRQLGRLFRAIFKFQLGEEVTVEEDIEMAFEFFKARFDLDESKYQGIVERNRNNGRKAATKKGAENNNGHPVAPSGVENTSTTPVAPSGTQWDPVAPSGVYNDNDSENENENENDFKDTSMSHEPDAGASSPPTEPDQKKEDNAERIPYERIVRLWNDTCKGLLAVHKLSAGRKSKIKTRVAEMGGVDKAMGTLGIVFRKIIESPFLRGDVRQWRATFDWVFANDKNWMKVLEGNYDDHEPSMAHVDRMNTNMTNFSNEGKRYEQF